MSAQHEGALELPAQGFKAPLPWIVNLPDVDSSNHALAVLLAHGAGGDASSGNLPAIAAAVAEGGTPCLRFTARGGSLQHRINAAKALLAAAPTLPGLQHVQRWVLAGHSMGARVAASLAGEQPLAAPVAACLLLSYPLHPPGKPAELRDGLLHQLRLPTLLVRGSKDPFSTQLQWDAALQGMHAACAWRQHTVEGGDHGLQVGGPNGAAHTAAALHSVCTAVQQFVREAQQAAEQPHAQQATVQQQQQQQGVQGSGRGRPSRGQAATTARAPAGRKRGQASPAGGKHSRAPAATKAAGGPEKKAGKRARRV